MYTIKKLFIFTAMLFVFFFMTSQSYAIPGQLIYGMDSPQPIDNSACDDALSVCTTLSKTCETQKSQCDMKNIALTNELTQAKKTVFILELLLGVVVFFSIITITIILFIKKRLVSSLKRPF